MAEETMIERTRRIGQLAFGDDPGYRFEETIEGGDFRSVVEMLRTVRKEAYEECAAALDALGDKLGGAFLRRESEKRNG